MTPYIVTSSKTNKEGEGSQKNYQEISFVVVVFVVRSSDFLNKNRPPTCKRFDKNGNNEKLITHLNVFFALQQWSFHDIPE